MPMRRTATFLLQATAVGLVAALALLFLAPERAGQPVVEVHSAAAAERAPAASSYADAVERAAPSVVNIYTRKKVVRRDHPFMDDPFFRRFFGDRFGVPRERMESSLGSGVIVSEDGYILTNHHVIQGADAIEVALHDGRTAEASVVGSDPGSDLAVLRIELEELPTAEFGDSEELRVGDVVLALGNPFGVGRTVTQGIISATGRNQSGLSAFEDFLQTDAAINPGNSGGALVDAGGRLVGINTAIYSRTGGHMGIGFAIPADRARAIFTDLVETGRVERGWLGIEVQELSPRLRESFGLEGDDGVVITGLLRDGPAHKAGLRPGDVITRIAGEPVDEMDAALRRIADLEPGTEVELTGLRNGQQRTWEVTVGERPERTQRRR
ncbi:MAG: S1C family serine protease [Pseudomonadota bacterium]